MSKAKPDKISPADLDTPTDLPAAAVEAVSKALNPLLADAFALYLKTKNFHWHVSGRHFRDYHLMLDEQSDAIFATTDQLAERLQLLAAISHDLKTPITRMRLRAEQIEPPSLREKVLHDLLAMQHLVDEGLTYARTAHATTEPLRKVDLKALLDGLICDAIDAGGNVVIIDSVVPTLQTRVQALTRVLTNLIDNAVSFGVRAEIRITETPETVTISVFDEGPGIPPADLERVFDPFFRVEDSRSRETGGTGLGLAIARQLTLALGGQLTLHNRPIRGLEARLTLPRIP